MLRLILLFSSVIAPLLVGICLSLFKYWLETRGNNKRK
ncbi:type I toxin-antitoxin system Fst family toxin [Listeria valentina]|nr:type I toxin-antitoxin system Fst family toxin [Listeria valentina]